MIKFRCSSCNQKFGVAEEYAGKTVKCTKCGQAIRVPRLEEQAVQEKPAMIKFHCPHCNKKFSVRSEYAGKRGKCKGCGQAIRVPKPAEEAVQKEAAVEDIVGSDMFGDNFPTDELLAVEAGSPAAEETLKVKPVLPERQSEFNVRCPNCGALNRADSEFCTTCAQRFEREAGVGGGRVVSNMGVAILAGFGLTLLGAVGWALLAGLVGKFWVSFLATLVAALAGVGLTLFTDRRSVGIGMLAVLIGFVGIISAKVFIAKWVVMPELMPKIKKGIEGGLDRLEDGELTDEMVRDALENPNMMFAVTLMQLAEDGEFEEEFARKVVVARLMQKKLPELQEEVEAAERRVYACLGEWTAEQKETVVRAQLPKLFREFAGVLMESKVGSAIGFFTAFFLSFSCLDVLWFPLAFWGAYRVGAGPR